MGLGSALCVIVLAGNIYTSLDAGIGVVKGGGGRGGLKWLQMQMEYSRLWGWCCGRGLIEGGRCAENR
jgi:hypothetical protein